MADFEEIKGKALGNYVLCYYSGLGYIFLLQEKLIMSGACC